MESKWLHLMPVFIDYCHFLYDLLYILIGGLHNAIHLRPVMRRNIMLDLKLRIEFGDHSIIEVGTIIWIILSGIPY